MFVYRPWAEQMKVGWLDDGHDSGDRNSPLTHNRCLSSSDTETDSHTARASYFATGRGVTGLCFEEVHSMTVLGPMREQTVRSVWVMIDSLLDYSEALVMNLLHVLVLFSLGVSRSVSLVHGFSCAKSGKYGAKCSFPWLTFGSNKFRFASLDNLWKKEICQSRQKERFFSWMTKILQRGQDKSAH